MAIGGKLGKVFGAIGSGLSFIPGPWSAIGMALGAAGSAASAVGAKKEREEAERKAQEQSIAPQQPEAQDDNARPEAAQILNMPGQVATQQTTAPIFNQSAPSLGGYQLKIDQEIANMLIRDVGGLYDN
jgi:hypothetical protein